MNCCQRHSLGRLLGIEIEVARHHGGPICIGLWTSEPSLFGSLGWKFLGFVAPGAIHLWLRPPWFWCFSSSIGQSEPIKITQPKWGTYEKPRQATCPRIIDDEHEESVIKVGCEVCVWVRWADWADCGPAQRADRKVHRWYRSKSCGEWVRQGRAWLPKLPSSHPWWTEVHFFFWAGLGIGFLDELDRYVPDTKSQAPWRIGCIIASCCVAQIDFCPGNFQLFNVLSQGLAAEVRAGARGIQCQTWSLRGRLWSLLSLATWHLNHLPWQIHGN